MIYSHYNLRVGSTCLLSGGSVRYSQVKPHSGYWNLPSEKIPVGVYPSDWNSQA